MENISSLAALEISAPFVYEFRFWELNLEIWVEMSRIQAWQLNEVFWIFFSLSQIPNYVKETILDFKVKK